MPSEAQKRKRVLEPRIDPHSKKMDVGGLEIQPTSQLTALLYGFAHHPNNKAKEFYFWRICDELWNHEDLPEPMMVRHPWAEKMIRAALNVFIVRDRWRTDQDSGFDWKRSLR